MPAALGHSDGVGTPSRALRTWETLLMLMHACCSLLLTAAHAKCVVRHALVNSDAVVRAKA